ncbi:hypothetical protein NPA08_04170 [Mycoplasmopsis citelli]|uniref:hypothetical protein n=1 Tax=Mycoplasmopsis citelli TaxID=171281 RepID=UPI002113B7CB|nr:hypothetical protein [Mycoplasmopsis citelli]UUD36117.1 hypothetical protein NPA08_04170 [Mycoplasmopsis citelli]
MNNIQTKAPPKNQQVNSFRIFQQKYSQNKKNKYFLTLFSIENRIFIIELLDDMSKISEQIREDVAKLPTKSNAPHNLYVSFNKIFMYKELYFQANFEDITDKFINNQLADLFRFNVYNKIANFIDTYIKLIDMTKK